MGVWGLGFGVGSRGVGCGVWGVGVGYGVGVSGFRVSRFASGSGGRV